MTCRKGKINRGPCPRSRLLRVWSRSWDRFGSPPRVSLLILYTHGTPPDFRGGVHLFIYTAIEYAIGPVPSLSGHAAIVHRWHSLPRESADTGPVVLKVVPVTGAAFAGQHGPVNVRLSFPTPSNIVGMKLACRKSHTKPYNIVKLERSTTCTRDRKPFKYDTSKPFLSIHLIKGKKHGKHRGLLNPKMESKSPTMRPIFRATQEGFFILYTKEEEAFRISANNWVFFLRWRDNVPTPAKKREHPSS